MINLFEYIKIAEGCCKMVSILSMIADSILHYFMHILIAALNLVKSLWGGKPSEVAGTIVTTNNERAITTTGRAMLFTPEFNIMALIPVVLVELIVIPARTLIRDAVVSALVVPFQKAIGGLMRFKRFVLRQ